MCMKQFDAEKNIFDKRQACELGVFTKTASNE